MNPRSLLLPLCAVLALTTSYAQSPTLQTLQPLVSYGGHKGPVEALTFSPDGTRLFVMAGTTGYVLDARTTQVLRTIPMGQYVDQVTWPSEHHLRLEGMGKVVTFDPTTGVKTGGQQFARSGTVAVSTAGIAAVEAERSIGLYDLNTGLKIRAVNTGTIYLDSFALSPDGRRLATADISDGARLYNAENGTLVRALLPDVWTEGVTFTPDGTQVIVAGEPDDEEPGLFAFDAATGESLGRIVDLDDTADTFAWGPGGLLAAGNYGDVFVVDTRTGNLKYTFGGFDRSSLQLALSPDGTTLAYGSWFGDLRLASLTTGRVTQSLSGLPGGNTWCLEVSPSGKQVLTCGYDRTARVYDLASGKTVLSLPGHPHWVSGGTFIPGGGIATLSDETINIWNGQGQKLKSWTVDTDDLDHLTAHPSGKYLAYAADEYGENGEVIVREVATGKVTARIPAGEDGVDALTFSPNGRTVTILNGKGRLSAVNWAQGTVTGRANVGDTYRDKLLTDPKGRYLALEGVQDGVQLLDATTLKPLKFLPVAGLQRFQFTVSGDGVIVNTAQKLTVIDVRSGQARATFASVGSVGEFRPLADGRHLVMEVDPKGGPNSATLFRAPTGTPFK